MATVHFLSDIFEHLNTSNFQLQGRHKTIIDLVEKLKAFKVKFNVFSNDLNSGKFLHFHRLGRYINITSTVVTKRIHVSPAFLT